MSEAAFLAVLCCLMTGQAHQRTSLHSGSSMMSEPIFVRERASEHRRRDVKASLPIVPPAYFSNPTEYLQISGWIDFALA